MRKIIFFFAITLATTACFDDAKNALAEAKAAATKAQEAANAARAAANKVAGKSDGEPQNLDDAAKNFGEAMENFGKAVAKDGTISEPINFRKLKPFLPSKIGAAKKGKTKGSTSGMQGIKVSVAEAQYGQGKTRGTLKITDTGGLRGLFAMAFMWTSIEIDEESDDGHKRTIKFAGQPALEEFRTSGQRSTVTVIVGNRFIVEASGRGMPLAEVKSSLKDIDFSKLEKLAKATTK